MNNETSQLELEKAFPRGQGICVLNICLKYAHLVPLTSGLVEHARKSNVTRRKEGLWNRQLGIEGGWTSQEQNAK